MKPPAAAPVRAVICDVYHTLLRPLPPPPDATARWTALWHRTFGSLPGPSLTEFDAACRTEVTARNDARRAAGEPWPEVDWESVALAAAPALATLTAAQRDTFLAAHARLQRGTALLPATRRVLGALRQAGCLLGIASNAQPYTRHELAAAALPLTWFAPDLCFWSGDHGIAKPSPQVFARLAAALAARGIAPHETLMIGDRADNDIEPARAAGWQTWHFREVPGHDWPALGAALLARHSCLPRP